MCRFSICLLACAVSLVMSLAVPLGFSLAGEPAPLVRYGSMREALAQHEDQARVRLAELIEEEHFFAVGALEGLQGEITILDSVAFATGVATDGTLLALDASSQAATLLVGQSIPDWFSIPVDDAVTPDRFDDLVGVAASAHGVDVSAPFLFVLEGELSDVRLHVIHGACPVHARMNKIELPDAIRPYEMETQSVGGTIVGVYAADAVGRLTHPATRTHAHLIFVDPATGTKLTAHLERVGVAKGATLRVPDPRHGKEDVEGEAAGR